MTPSQNAILKKAVDVTSCRVGNAHPTAGN